MDLADALTASRAVCGIVLAVAAVLPRTPRRAVAAVFIWGVASDWLDGPLARGRGATASGARRDLAADSLLTLGASAAAVRAGLGLAALLGPLLHYAAWQPRTALERQWDRITGVAQMSVYALALLGSPGLARVLAPPVVALRCAHLASRGRPPYALRRRSKSLESPQRDRRRPARSIPRGTTPRWEDR